MRLAPALAVLASASVAAAQCSWSSVSVSSYGQGCNAAFPNQPLSVGASLDASQCRLDLDVTAFPGCCNALLVGNVLVLGFSQVSLPATNLGPGCTLLASPDLLIYQPGSVGGTFQLHFQNVSLPPVTFCTQAASLYFTSFDCAASAGARIDLQ